MLRKVTACWSDYSGIKATLCYGHPKPALQHQISLLAAKLCPEGIEAALKQGPDSPQA
jgi:hypothetical protein